MAGRTEEGIGEPETVALQTAILASDLLDAIGRDSASREDFAPRLGELILLQDLLPDAVERESLRAWCSGLTSASCPCRWSKESGGSFSIRRPFAQTANKAF